MAEWAATSASEPAAESNTPQASSLAAVPLAGTAKELVEGSDTSVRRIGGVGEGGSGGSARRVDEVLGILISRCSSPPPLRFALTGAAGAEERFTLRADVVLVDTPVRFSLRSSPADTLMLSARRLPLAIDPSTPTLSFDCLRSDEGSELNTAATSCLLIERRRELRNGGLCQPRDNVSPCRTLSSHTTQDGYSKRGVPPVARSRCAAARSVNCQLGS